MRAHRTTLVLLAGLGACTSASDSRKYSVYFEPYSAALDRQGHETIDAAARFAQSHPLQPVVVDGFAAPPDPQRDVDGLSAQRAETVKQALVSGGVSPGRITAVANGITDPRTLPSVAVRRVDIGVGQ